MFSTSLPMHGPIKTARYLPPHPRGDGDIEMDETYVGGKKHVVGKRGRGVEKDVVIGILKSSGEVRFFVSSRPAMLSLRV